jgi:hypothetical protein
MAAVFAPWARTFWLKGAFAVREVFDPTRSFSLIDAI